MHLHDPEHGQQPGRSRLDAEQERQGHRNDAGHIQQAASDDEIGRHLFRLRRMVNPHRPLDDEEGKACPQRPADQVGRGLIGRIHREQDHGGDADDDRGIGGFRHVAGGDCREKLSQRGTKQRFGHRTRAPVAPRKPFGQETARNGNGLTAVWRQCLDRGGDVNVSRGRPERRNFLPAGLIPV